MNLFKINGSRKKFYVNPDLIEEITTDDKESKLISIRMSSGRYIFTDEPLSDLLLRLANHE